MSFALCTCYVRYIADRSGKQIYTAVLFCVVLFSFARCIYLLKSLSSRPSPSLVRDSIPICSGYRNYVRNWYGQ